MAFAVRTDSGNRGSSGHGERESSSDDEAPAARKPAPLELENTVPARHWGELVARVFGKRGQERPPAGLMAVRPATHPGVAVRPHRVTRAPAAMGYETTLRDRPRARIGRR